MPRRRNEPLSIQLFTEDMPEFDLLRYGIGKAVVSEALSHTASKLARRWRQRVDESEAKTGFKRRYRESIQMDVLSPTRVRVSARGKFVSFVEKGIKSFDMKPGLLAGNRARMSQDGYPYNIIAFRHGTPGSTRAPMSAATYREVRAIPMEQRMVRVGMGRRKNVRGDWVAQPVYRPGYGRTGDTGPAPRTAGQGKWYQHRHRAGAEAGMVKTGAPGHTGYVTFRVVSARSRTRSWRYPGIPAAPIFPKINADAPELIKNSFTASILRSLGLAAARGAGE